MILIENYYDHYKDTLVNYLYEKTNNSVTCFEIINDTLVSATLKYFTIEDMKPSFDYAKEVFVKEKKPMTKKNKIEYNDIIKLLQIIIETNC